MGEGEARATVLVLHTLEMHVDLSFSYLRFAEAASFDKKSYAGAVHVLTLLSKGVLTKLLKFF